MSKKHHVRSYGLKTYDLDQIKDYKKAGEKVTLKRVHRKEKCRYQRTKKTRNNLGEQTAKIQLPFST